MLGKKEDKNKRRKEGREEGRKKRGRREKI